MYQAQAVRTLDRKQHSAVQHHRAPWALAGTPGPRAHSPPPHLSSAISSLSTAVALSRSACVRSLSASSRSSTAARACTGGGMASTAGCGLGGGGAAGLGARCASRGRHCRPCLSHEVCTRQVPHARVHPEQNRIDVCRAAPPVTRGLPAALPAGRGMRRPRRWHAASAARPPPRPPAARPPVQSRKRCSRRGWRRPRPAQPAGWPCGCPGPQRQAAAAATRRLPLRTLRWGQ